VVSAGAGPVFDDFLAAKFAGGLFEHALDAFPVFGPVGLGKVAVVEIVGPGGAEFENGVGGRALEAGVGAEVAAAIVVVGRVEAFHFDDDIDKSGQSAAAARGHAGGAGALGLVMGEEDADAAGGEAPERHQGFEHEGGGVFVAAGEEGGQRVDDEQIEFADVLHGGEMVDEVEPVVVGGFAVEGPAEPGDVVAEGPFVVAKTPLLIAFFAEDDGMARVNGGVGEVAAGAEAVEKDGDERGLAGFPQAGEEG
jgi:hypothetical protein